MILSKNKKKIPYFYSRTSDSSLETQKPIICETVDELLTTCFDLMTRCMDSDEEIRDLRERQGDLLATLFYRLTYTIGTFPTLHLDS